MRQVIADSYDAWRKISRELLTEQVAPESVIFHADKNQKLLPTQQRTFLSSPPQVKPQARRAARVPPKFLAIAEEAAAHRDADRFNLLYRILWRLTHGEPRLLEVAVDEDVHRLQRLKQAVARDIHKMHAFVRFRRVEEAGHEQYIAWHRPDHYIVRLAAPFFGRRFPNMDWTILTPDESVHWNGTALEYGPGVPASEAPQADDLETMWKTYYRSIFNPARVNLPTMKREMPVRHWRTLPETRDLPLLLAEAPQRVQTMIERQPTMRPAASSWIPAGADLPTLAAAAAGCQGCDLCGPATQTVFGEGPATARLMLVGEQPGDEEDRAGRPFIGPAGQVLNAALAEAGIDRSQVYVTNAVKHFRFEQRGKRRLHQKPTYYQMSACQPWFAAEANLIQPAVLVCLGATAIQAILKERRRLSDLRGQVLETSACRQTIATYHPSAVLRAGDPTHEAEIRAALITDLRKAVALLAAA